MFTPNQTAVLTRKTGRNLDGEEIYGEPEPLAIAVVNLARVSERTAVRSDSSASRGNADQFVAEGKILALEPSAVDDRIEILGGLFRVTGAHPRWTVAGTLDHYEIMLEAITA